MQDVAMRTFCFSRNISASLAIEAGLAPARRNMSKTLTILYASEARQHSLWASSPRRQPSSAPLRGRCHAGCHLADITDASISTPSNAGRQQTDVRVISGEERCE